MYLSHFLCSFPFDLSALGCMGCHCCVPEVFDNSFLLADVTFGNWNASSVPEICQQPCFCGQASSFGEDWKYITNWKEHLGVLNLNAHCNYGGGGDSHPHCLVPFLCSLGWELTRFWDCLLVFSVLPLCILFTFFWIGASVYLYLMPCICFTVTLNFLVLFLELPFSSPF